MRKSLSETLNRARSSHLHGQHDVHWPPIGLSFGVIISAGVIGSFNMNTITVLSCLMGPESAFLALMPTYNSPERPMVSGNQLSSIFLDIDDFCFDHVTVTVNRANSDVGVMRDMIFRGNSAASSEGALYVLNNSLINYAVLFVNQSPATASLQFTNCTFSLNRGNMGAAIYTSVDTTFIGGSIGNHPVVQSSIYDVSSGLTSLA
ncbi:hypothetical protein PROFUN_11906 [Planoprotostelium fungivorum]|uniref:Uncharacterized protein n=1 Tax=Planoprotostelium fungivorum TaxID=1890364 RepID=A0A2P6N931_9EUKA|nr:hypothetical protein PROFUN_11906 [Planoprotostelium fungivorum]